MSSAYPTYPNITQLNTTRPKKQKVWIIWMFCLYSGLTLTRLTWSDSVPFPVSPILNLEFGKEVHHVGISSKKNMKAGLYPVTIFILPRRNLQATAQKYIKDLPITSILDLDTVYTSPNISADPCLRQGRGGAWDRRRREACRWLCTGFALAIADWACHRFFGRLGHKVIGLTACNPDVWLPSNPSRQGTAATGCRLWHNGLFFTGFQSGRLAALKPFPAGYGCHWLC